MARSDHKCGVGMSVNKIVVVIHFMLFSIQTYRRTVKLM